MKLIAYVLTSISISVAAFAEPNSSSEQKVNPIDFQEEKVDGGYDHPEFRANTASVLKRMIQSCLISEDQLNTSNNQEDIVFWNSEFCVYVRSDEYRVGTSE